MSRFSVRTRTTRRRGLVGIAAFILGWAVAPSAGVSYAQAPADPRAETVALSPGAPESRGPGRVGIVLDPAAWQRLFRAGDARVAAFPLPGGRRVDLEVSGFDPVGAQARFFVRDSQGLQEMAAPSMRFFRGQVEGDPESLVSLNLFGGRIAGFVRHDGREYTFGPRAHSVDHGGADDIEIVDEALEGGPSGRCEGDAAGSDTAGGDSGGPIGAAAAPAPAIDVDTMLLGRIAVEGTVEWVTKHGGVAAATTYTLNLMAQVSAIYENDIKVQLQVPYILMNAAEPDGYTGGSNNTSTALGEMRAKWNGTTSLQSVFRTAAHLFGTYSSGGAGRAYVNVLCNNVPVNANSADYGVSLLEGNGGSWERRLVAHEIGHNFSSPHSHCYTPEIDRCYNSESGCYAGTVVQTTGTIMSYCNARLSSFHQRERDEKIRPGAQAAYPRCVDAAATAAPPSGLTAAPLSASRIRLTWQDNSDSESGFRIERCQGSACADFALLTTTAANVTGHEDTGLLASTTYRYRVAAVNASGTSAFSNTAAAATDDPPPSGDADGDGIDDGVDNCPGVANAGQQDADADGAGDLCDTCPGVADPGQQDADADRIGDACEDPRVNANSDATGASTLRIDGADLFRLGRAFGTRRGDLLFDPFVDLNRDQRVDGTDLALLALVWGEHLP